MPESPSVLPRYKRNRRGDVVHRFDCVHVRHQGVEWTFAEGESIEWLVEQLPKYPWLRFCRFCLTQPTVHGQSVSSATVTEGGQP